MIHVIATTLVSARYPEYICGSEEGSCLRLIDFVSLNSRLESNNEEEEPWIHLVFGLSV